MQGVFYQQKLEVDFGYNESIMDIKCMATLHRNYWQEMAINGCIKKPEFLYHTLTTGKERMQCDCAACEFAGQMMMEYSSKYAPRCAFCPIKMYHESGKKCYELSKIDSYGREVNPFEEYNQLVDAYKRDDCEMPLREFRHRLYEAQIDVSFLEWYDAEEYYNEVLKPILDAEDPE